VALELQRAGWPNARALVGGWDAWVRAGLPVAPREEEAEAAAR
jgi:3-mercaptopyruvate sulfurtransferase SseA